MSVARVLLIAVVLCGVSVAMASLRPVPSAPALVESDAWVEADLVDARSDSVSQRGIFGRSKTKTGSTAKPAKKTAKPVKSEKPAKAEKPAKTAGGKAEKPAKAATPAKGEKPNKTGAGKDGQKGGWKASGGSDKKKDKLQKDRQKDIKNGKYATTSDGQKITQSQTKSTTERADGKPMGLTDKIGAKLHENSAKGKAQKDISNQYDVSHLKTPEKTEHMIKNPLARQDIGGHRNDVSSNPTYKPAYEFGK